MYVDECMLIGNHRSIVSNLRSYSILHLSDTRESVGGKKSEGSSAIYKLTLLGCDRDNGIFRYQLT
jgi:hypothetical protein